MLLPNFTLSSSSLKPQLKTLLPLENLPWLPKSQSSVSPYHLVFNLLEHSIVTLYYCVSLHESRGWLYLTHHCNPAPSECLAHSMPSINELCWWIRIMTFLCSFLYSSLGFLNHLTLLSWIILCCRGYPVHCRRFCSNPSLYLLDANSTHIAVW